MKVGILGESSTDEAVVRVLVEALLGTSIEVLPLWQRPGGIKSVLETLPAIIRHLHYQTDAEAMVVVLDANHSPIHLVDGEDHVESARSKKKECRVCLVRKLLERVQKNLSGRAPAKTAVGLVAPALEAWLLCDLEPQVTEARWIQGLREGKDPYSKLWLKERLYGSSRAPENRLEEIAVREARRLAADLNRLEECFPHGFGILAGDVRSWLEQ